jgi:hypothetical protein
MGFARNYFTRFLQKVFSDLQQQILTLNFFQKYGSGKPDRVPLAPYLLD